jgi:putative phosphoribosyl transferase
MESETFRDREDAARQLAQELKGLELRDPLVLGIPRGGVITAATVAHELNAEMDVVLVRKLRHPLQPELAIGALSEDGQSILNPETTGGFDENYLRREKEERFAELKSRRDMFRGIRSAASMEGRSVIITDDGIATGSTVFAAVRVVKAHNPHEVIVAVPVAPPSTLKELGPQCDRVVCLMSPESFMAIGQFYDDFAPVEDEQACAVLGEFAHAEKR